MEKNKKEKNKEESLAEIEVKIRKRVGCEERAHEIVLGLVDNPISEEHLQDVLNYIHTSQYVDVTEERAIDKLCGYPLCPKSLPKQPKQKYRISTKTNKVYDITERKNFCSNQCYKASKYLESQISSSAVWARDLEPSGKFDFLSIDDTRQNTGSSGENVLSHPASEIKQELNDIESASEQQASGAKFTSVNDLVDQVSNLLISEENQTGPTPLTANTEGSNDEVASEIENQIAESNGSLASGQQEISFQDLAQQVSDEFLLNDKPEESVSLVGANTNADLNSEEEMNRSRTHRSVGTNTNRVPNKEPSDKDIPFKGEKDLSLYKSETVMYEAALKKIGNTQVLPTKRGPDLRENDPMVPLAHPDVVSQGIQDQSTIQTTIGNKAKLLMDLIDKRNTLLAQLKKAEPTDKSTHSEGKSSMQVTSQISPVIFSPRQEQSARYSTPMTQSSFKSDQELIRKNVKVKASSVMENIRRITSQHGGSKAKVSDTPSQSYPGVGSLEPIRRAMFEWKTPDTVLLFSKGLKSGDQTLDGSDFKAKYAALGRKVDALDMSGLLGEEEWDDGKASLKHPPDFKQLEKDTVQQDMKVREFFKGNMKYPVMENVVDEDDLEIPECFRPRKKTTEAEKEPLREPVLPLVDSHSQMAIRRKLILDKLNKVLPDLLKPLRMVMVDVISDVKSTVNTFSLSATNIVFKPAEWIVLGYVLLQLLSYKNTTLRMALGQEELSSFGESLLTSAGVSQKDVDNIIYFMISEEESLALYQPS